MMHVEIGRPRWADAPWRLRWKLTLGYTLVTVAAVLVFDVCSVATQVAAARDRLRPIAIVNALLRTTSPRLKPYLAGSSTDVAGLWRILGLIAVDEATQDNADVTGGIGTLESALFVVDAHGRILAALPPLAGLSVGARFARRFPGAGVSPLTTALAGVRDPARLSEQTGDGRVLAAAPIFGDGGRVRGAVVREARAPSWTRLVAVEVVQSALILTLGAGMMGTLFGFVTAAGLTRRLQRLSGAADAWGHGDFNARAADASRDELGRLARDLNGMADQVRVLLLEQKSHAALEARSRLARDLHDAVKQQVFATAMQIGAARKLLYRDQGAAEVHLAQADALVRGTQQELVALINALRPPGLETQGLTTALRLHAQTWTAQTDVALRMHVGVVRETDPAVEQVLFRAAQEALSNVARHSGARSVDVGLAWDEASVTLYVQDDGQGFTVGAASAGFGLESIRGRLAQVGGTVVLDSAPGRGARVTCICRRAQPSRQRVKRA